MLRLNHPRFNTICVGRQERSKRQQSAAAHIRQALLLHLTAKTGVEHPLRNLQRSQPVQLVSHATENYTPASSRFASNAYWLPIPWMPAIMHFSNAGFMGVLYPSCTTASGHTARSGYRTPEEFAKRLCECGKQKTLSTFAQPRRRLRAIIAAKLKSECSHLRGLSEGGSSLCLM